MNPKLLTGSEVHTGPFDRTAAQGGGESSGAWGVDGSTLRVSIAVCAGEESGDSAVATRSFNPKLRGPERLSHILTETRAFVFERFAHWGHPAKVFVEQPSGKTVNIPFVQAVGVIELGIFLAMGGEQEQIPSGRWKAIGLGYGSAKKPDIMAWARRHEDYDGDVQDEADALGIARAGYRILHAPQQQELAPA